MLDMSRYKTIRYDTVKIHILDTCINTLLYQVVSIRVSFWIQSSIHTTIHITIRSEVILARVSHDTCTILERYMTERYTLRYIHDTCLIHIRRWLRYIYRYTIRYNNDT